MSPSSKDLKKAALLAEKIEQMQAELDVILGGRSSVPASKGPKETVAKPAKKKRKISAAGRAAIVAAQKKRWAEKKKQEK